MKLLKAIYWVLRAFFCKHHYQMKTLPNLPHPIYECEKCHKRQPSYVARLNRLR